MQPIDKLKEELIEELIEQKIIEEEKGGDLCIRCGKPIDHNEPHMYCSNCI